VSSRGEEHGLLGRHGRTPTGAGTWFPKNPLVAASVPSPIRVILGGGVVAFAAGRRTIGFHQMLGEVGHWECQRGCPSYASGERRHNGAL
jgi:hypothetical protein